jgi:hypothetical protein
VNDLLKKISAIDWKYIVSRRETLFFRSFTTFSYKYFEKVTGIPWKVTQEFRLEQEVLHKGSELEDLSRHIENGGIPILTDFKKRLKKNYKELYDFTKSLSKKGFSKFSKPKLEILLDKYITLELHAHNFLLPMAVADKVLSKSILEKLDRNEKEKQNYLAVLTYPTEENEHTKELLSFYKLVESFLAHDPNFHRKADRHLKEFSWIGTRYNWWQYE